MYGENEAPHAECRERVKELEEQLAEANGWRERHSNDAEARGRQTVEQFERIKELELDKATLDSLLADACGQIANLLNQIADLTCEANAAEEKLERRHAEIRGLREEASICEAAYQAEIEARAKAEAEVERLGKERIVGRIYWTIKHGTPVPGEAYMPTYGNGEWYETREEAAKAAEGKR